MIRFTTIAFLSCLLFLLSCSPKDNSEFTVIGKGQMPNLASDASTRAHVVFGVSDSIFYAYSGTSAGNFTSPVLVAVLQGLAASHMRGPQIAVTQKGIAITACNTTGDIFCYSKDSSGSWRHRSKVNDADTVAKEGLMALGGDGDLLFATWLDLRNGENEIYGSQSMDGGKSWSKNIRIYASPDSTVCECCKPSVVVKGDSVYVMFRNWLNGARDLYLTRSFDKGRTFEPPQKLGVDSWKLDACPMDGGGLAVKPGSVETVWRRDNKIYSCTAGKSEIAIGVGKSCTMESVNGKNYYAWVKGEDIIFLAAGTEERKLGKGILPILKRLDDKHLICVWEKEKIIHYHVVTL